MDFLKKQLETIQQNLSGLNATQKMLTGALVVIMVMTMVMWGRYAGTAEMEPVLNASLAPDDIARISAALDARGISNKVVGDKVMVSADRKMQALAELSYQQMLPRNSASAFDAMYGKVNTFTSPAERDAVFNRAREMTLGQIISGFPNVASADVMIDATTQRRIGGDVTPSATVNIRTRGDKPDKKLVNAAAELVCGAVSTISRSKIKVIIDGRAYAVQTEENSFDGAGGNILETKMAWEKQLARKVEDQLFYISGARASVSGVLNVETQSSRSKSYDKNAVVQPKTIETRTLESNTTAPPAGEVGVGANIGGMAIGGGGSGGTSTTDSTERTTNEVAIGYTDKTTSRPAGEFTAQQATVRLPRNYFVSMLKDRSGGKEPTSTELETLIQAELPTIRSLVAKCTGIKDSDEFISVDTYYEISPLNNNPSLAGGGSSGGGITAMVGGWGKEVAVGVLAVVSLFMVSTMVRKSTPAPVVVAAPEVKKPAALGGVEDVAGLASESGSTLAGMELDDDTIQAQQILDQVSNMVGEDPEAAANLVKRWLNRT